MINIKDSVIAGGYAAAWSVVKYVPEPVTSTTFSAMAKVLAKRDGQSVRQLALNLEQVAPGEDILDDAVASYLRYWHDVFRLPRWSQERLRDSFIFEGKEILDAAIRAGTGAVVVGGHSANWDQAAAWAAVEYGSVMSVAERLKPVQLFDQFVAARKSIGLDIIGLGEPDIVRALLARLKAGEIVALLGDRDLGGNGVEVEFFGRMMTVPGGPAMLSLLSGAPLLGLQLWYDGPLLRGRLSEPITVPKTASRSEQLVDLSQATLNYIAAGIADHPVDWHMMQPIWPGVRAV
jgi:lauroyl/myristoyl acyltransferase